MMNLNPVSIPVEQIRNILNRSEYPDILPLGIYTLVGVMVAWSGRWFFEKTRHGFADAI
jgi:lipopolysaccharide transport system permease protein